MSNRTWLSEHGKGYAVPEAVLKLFRDCSWHNEMCPRFAVGSIDENSLSLWVDHPVAEEREIEGNGRYLVCRPDFDGPNINIYEGDDLDIAIAAALRVARDEFKALLSTKQLFYLAHGYLMPEANEAVLVTENERLLLHALRQLRLEAIHYRDSGTGKLQLTRAINSAAETLIKVSKKVGPEALLGDRIDIEANDPRVDR